MLKSTHYADASGKIVSVKYEREDGTKICIGRAFPELNGYRAVAVETSARHFVGGLPHVFGDLNEPKPAKGFPDGSLEWLRSQNSFVLAKVTSGDGARFFFVGERNGHWIPMQECDEAGVAIHVAE